MAKATASSVISNAKKEISSNAYTRPNKYTSWFSLKYGNAYLKAPWCGIFVAYVIDQMCGDTDMLKDLKNTVAGVGYIYNWAKKNNYVKMSGKKGDLVIFDWECGNGTFEKDHVGFFIKDNGNGTITTIEGNTSSVSDGNGNHVQQRVRDKKYVGCYVRLPYKEEATIINTTGSNKYTGQFPVGTLSTSAGTKDQIKLWQKFLNWSFGYDLKVDGIFGTMTYKVTKEFQTKVGITSDGIVGPNTLKKAKAYTK